MKKTIILGGLLLALSGCATSSGLQPTVSYSGFDQSKIVSIAPHGTACPSMSCDVIGVGAEWNAAYPEVVVLTLQSYLRYTTMTDLRIRADNMELTADKLGITDHHYSTVEKSTAGFAVPLDFLRKMQQADRIWLRVSTPTGALDYAVKDGETDSKAYHAIGRFLEAVGRA